MEVKEIVQSSKLKVKISSKSKVKSSKDTELRDNFELVIFSPYYKEADFEL